MRRWFMVLVSVLLCAEPGLGQQTAGTISGRVTERVTGAPLGGADVVVIGAGLTTRTRDDGRYLIPGVSPGTHRVRVSLIGYASVEETVTVPSGRGVTADFELVTEAIELEEIVAVGYGTQRRRDVTGAVSSVRGEDVLLRAAPTSTVSSALQGKAPGVQVVTNSGMPGIGVSVRIRGSNSITANSEPLYVLDGVPVTQGTSSDDPTQNPLNTLNPNDVESIEILKDASATSIYGARGANGVVLITTRRGFRGDDRITLESSYGVQEIATTIEVMNARQYRQLRNEALVNVGQSPRYTDAEVDAAATYDYPSMLLRTAPQQNHTLTFSGGDGQTRYLLSGNFVDQEGIVGGTDFRRYSARLNLDREFSAGLRMGTSLSLARIRHNLSRVENGQLAGDSRGMLGAMVFDPAIAPRDEDGEWVQRAVMAEFIENPVATVAELTDQRNETRLVGNVFAELDVRDGVRLRSSVGANVWDAYNPSYAPSNIWQGALTGGRATIWQGRVTEVLNENLVTYRHDAVGPGTLDVTGGLTIQTNDYDWTYMEATNFLVEQPGWNAVQGGSNRPSISSGASDWTLLSILGRANYNFSDRYLFTFTVRRDGSSRFGANNKWALFPSGAFAWHIADEAFMRDRTFLSDLKLRLSYGRTGNQAVDPYNSLAQLAATRSAVGGTNRIAFAPGSRAPNPDLRWETTQQWNAGVDLGFLDDRVTVTADAYRSRTEDLLLVVNMPWTSGFADQLRNIGSVENRGFELAIGALNLERGDFTWRSALNLAHNRNEVTDLGGDVESIVIGEGNTRGWSWAIGGASHIVKPGEPLGSIYGYRVLGLWQEGQPCDVAAPRPTLDCIPGELHIQDVNGDGQITPDDRTIIGNADPDVYGGFTNNLAYGPFSIDAFINFSVGNDVVNASNAFLMNSTGAMNERVEVLNRWTPENTDTDIPRANANRRTLLYSTLVEDGSFVRLQSFTLGYRIPPTLLRGAREARVYVTGQNLWTITGYTGFDPEANSLGGSPAAPGLDVGAYPRARAWNFGVNVTF